MNNNSDNDSTRGRHDSLSEDDDRDSIDIIQAPFIRTITRPIPPPRMNTMVDLIDVDDVETQEQTLVENIPVISQAPVVEQEEVTVIHMNDNDDVIIWDEDFMFNSPTVDVFRKLSTTVRVWKEAEWTVLIVIDNVKSRFGVFLGIDNPAKLPYGWKMKTRFRFALINENGEEIDSGMPFSVPFFHLV